MTQPYDRQRVPNADVLARQQSRLSEIWRRWLSALVELVNTKVGLPWKLDEATGGLYPSAQVGGETPGIGTLDNPVNHVAFGTTAPLGVQGFISTRDPATTEGGIQIVGSKEQDPGEPGAVVNAPIYLNGALTAITNQLWLQVNTPIIDDHYLMVGPSVVGPDGLDYAPVLLGPQIIYTDEQEASDATDWDVTDALTTVVTMTMDRTLAANATTVGYEVNLAELGGHNTQFTMTLRVNSVTVTALTRVITLNANSGQVLSSSGAYPAGLVPGDVVDVQVIGASTHPQSSGWVLGSDAPSRVVARQG